MESKFVYFLTVLIQSIVFKGLTCFKAGLFTLLNPLQIIYSNRCKCYAYHKICGKAQINYEIWNFWASFPLEQKLHEHSKRSMLTGCFVQ